MRNNYNYYYIKLSSVPFLKADNSWRSYFVLQFMFQLVLPLTIIKIKILIYRLLSYTLFNHIML